MKIITEAKAAADRQAAEEIAALIREKPDAVLALAAGESPKGVYAGLRTMCGRGELSFAGVRIFALTEYADLPLEHPQNCRHMLEESLISGIDILQKIITRSTTAKFPPAAGLTLQSSALARTYISASTNRPLRFTASLIYKSSPTAQSAARPSASAASITCRPTG